MSKLVASIIDIRESRVADMSDIAAFYKLTGRCHRADKTLRLRHFSPTSRQLLSNAGALIDVNMEEDSLYTVVGANRAY